MPDSAAPEESAADDALPVAPVASSVLEEAHGDLLSISFLGLLFTQLLTAINDNIFRWLVIGVAKDYVEPSQIGLVLMGGTVCFVAPYLLLASPAGYLADRFSKRAVIIGCKIAEIVIMAIGSAAVLLGDPAAPLATMAVIFTIVACMGAQSALFSPSKLGAIPETLKSKNISAANGYFGLATIAATVVGAGVGSWLADLTGPHGKNPETWWWTPLVLVGVAIAGTLFSLGIRYVPPANPNRRFPWDAPVQNIRDLYKLFSHAALFRVALGIMFFWSIGALANLNIDQFAAEGGALSETAKNPLLISLVLGIGAGSVLAGLASGGRVELGMLPLGALGMAVCSLLLFTCSGEIFQPGSPVTTSLIWSCVLLFFLGGSAGLFSVPLESYLQQRSPREGRGAILAASNSLTFAGVVVSSVLFAALRAPVYEGSLENIPAAQRGLPLADDQARQLQQTVAEYQTAWEQPGARPDRSDYVSRLPVAAQQEAVVQLAWIDLHQRREAGETVPLSAFLADFDDADRPLAGEVYYQSNDLPLFSARSIFLLAGILTLPVLVYIVCLLPQATIRFLVWLVTLVVYRLHIHGRDNLPEEGGALLAPNHVSWLDGILLMLVSPRPVRMVAFRGNFEKGWLLWMTGVFRAILIGSKPKEIAGALKEAREALNAGDLVCIFPEGGISRTGQVQAFRPGMMKILKGTNVPIIPIYLDELWGSIFSFDQGKFFWKWPKKWPYPVSIFFGEPLTQQPHDIHKVRRAVQDLGALAVEQRKKRNTLITRKFIRRCKQRGKNPKVSDSTGVKLSGSELLARTIVLKRLLKRHVLKKDEKYIGVLLPPTCASVIANGAIALDHRISVNLNYTVSEAVMNSCIEQAGIKHVLTSKRFYEKLTERGPLNLNAEIVYLEDFKDKVTGADKAVAGLHTYVLPSRVVEVLHGLHRIDPHETATVIFTSGSTGAPKGVMLSYMNIGTNVEAVDQVVHLNSQDVLMGILPFFHSFGYTIAMWGVMGLDIRGVYHFNPLDAKGIGKLCMRNDVTLLLATPTFLRGYLRRVEPKQFAKLDVVVAGAERLPTELADAFEEKFGVRPVEGYGATELSPLVSVNVPPSRSSGNFQTDSKNGTVGRPIPGVAAKVTDLDTGEELGTDQPGMLWITGPNVMTGYLNRDDLTGEVVHDGWYKTGDVALIDEEGFIKITGRISRFSKIGGEMVPHIKVEEALNKALGESDEDGESEGIRLAVTSIADEKKGEQLVVLHTKIDKTPDDLRKSLSDDGFPNIYIPARTRFLEVETLPLLGSGKLDLKLMKQLAEEKFSAAEDE
ncbi:MFS transporter [Lignipirellula cremea]|uniref:Bifunctional protein Aas n=1 Tax=Lignipirellula cremea TaxID=2528010 RepID=A0A518DMM8_9BACT|nr:MFS transporter [Lignipirellula cremea]QDU93097.1 Bifunctional protein Aas [Lignipirellula cremea]